MIESGHYSKKKCAACLVELFDGHSLKPPICSMYYQSAFSFLFTMVSQLLVEVTHHLEKT